MACQNEVEELESVKLYPPNTELQDDSLIEFLNDLRHAVQEKDTSFILNHLNENVHLSFGGHVGLEHFRELWNISDSESKLWLTLQQILDLEGTFEEGIYISPYVFSNWIPGIDNFDHAAIISAQVNLFKTPENDSEVVTQLNFDVVKVDDDKSTPDWGVPLSQRENPLGGKDWYYVQTLDNKYEGYVNWQHIRSPNDYRIFIEKQDVEWEIVTLIAGD